MTRMTRRELLQVAGAAALLPRGALAASPDAAIVPNRSTTGVFVPPRGAAFMKWSFDAPEPSVSFADLQFGFIVFSRENAYHLDRAHMRVEAIGDGLRLVCTGLLWAGGQERASGRVEAVFRRNGSFVEWDTTAELERPIKAVATVIRGLPRGAVHPAGGAPIDPHDDELLFGYPFGGGDLFGANTAQGLVTPLLIVHDGGDFHFVSSLDDRVRTKRFYVQPGEDAYRIEAIHETEGWRDQTSVAVPRWRVGKADSIEAAVAPHYRHLERAYHIPRWEDRADVPPWLRKIALVVALHGMHFSGYVFNSFQRMLEILRFIAREIPPDRVLVFLPAWDGRYYWDYPEYRAAPRLGGDAELRRLVQTGKKLGYRFVPMFGANAANRRGPSFSGFADAATSRIDDDRMDLDWVDWDGDRHQEGWSAYMNLGVDSWRRWLTERIAGVIDKYDVDGYFLDIIGGWINNTKADMDEGARKMIRELAGRYPKVLVCGEFHYDALLAAIPLFHVHAPHAVPYARFFSHLSHPAPGRGSSGVHESGFSTFDAQTLSLPASPGLLPTLTVVDDTFTTYRSQMVAVVREARRRAGLG
jgi:hypothetical protein